MDSEIVGKFKIIIGDKGYDSEENYVIAKRYGLFAIIPARNEYVSTHLKEKQKKVFARRIQKKSHN